MDKQLKPLGIPYRTLKEMPKYKVIYQNELAEEITGRSAETIHKLMKRKKLTLAGAIRYYIANDSPIAKEDAIGFEISDEEDE